jgi:hypothetical protein
MSKKSRKRNKKILAALALAGGAAMLAKGKLGKGAGAVTGVVNPNAPKTNSITKKANVVLDAAPILRKPPIGRMRGAGTDAEAIAGQDLRAGGSDRVTGILPPSQLLTPQRTHRMRGMNFKGGGIAKRGTGAAYKRGGRVKSMGIAKRGGGAAKR